jgi:hypothetical protein
MITGGWYQMERTGICSEKLLVECLLSEQMSVRQFMVHCKENPKLLEILKNLGRRYEDVEMPTLSERF